jgi:hypothetical protein
MDMEATATRPHHRFTVHRMGEAGIHEHWIVDVAGGVVEIQRSPSADGYGSRREPKAGDRVAPAALPWVLLDIAEVLGTPAP